MVMSKVGKAVAQKITAGLDNLESAMFGGKLEKAKFIVHKDVELNQKIKEIEFFINPHTIQVTKEAQLKEEAVAGSTSEKKYSLTYPVCLKLSEMWFDTYDTRDSVRTKYINDIESLLDYNEETHYLPVVVFNWGQWTATGAIPAADKFYVTKVTVDYTLFLPDATPVRAKVDLSLEQIKPAKQELKERPKQSPDHAKLYTVRKGDPLQGIAMNEYEDPREWRRIAKTNNLEDPMELRPGMKLLVPPILK
jgi:hypothetical protein